MTDTLETLKSWGRAEDVFHVVSASGSEAGAWTAELCLVQDPELTLQLEKSASDPRIRIRHRIAIPPEVSKLDADDVDLLVQTVAEVGETRGQTIRCEMNPNAKEVTISALIYSDGFTRHCVNSTVEEILKTRNIINQHLNSFSDSLRRSRLVQEQIEEERRKAEEIFASLSQPRPFLEQPSEPQICPACGEPLNPGKPFCSSCGTRVA